MTRTILVLSMLAVTTASGQQRVFRAATELVSISVSVKRGNEDVTKGLVVGDADVSGVVINVTAPACWSQRSTGEARVMSARKSWIVA